MRHHLPGSRRRSTAGQTATATKPRAVPDTDHRPCCWQHNQLTARVATLHVAAGFHRSGADSKSLPRPERRQPASGRWTSITPSAHTGRLIAVIRGTVTLRAGPPGRPTRAGCCRQLTGDSWLTTTTRVRVNCMQPFEGGTSERGNAVGLWSPINSTHRLRKTGCHRSANRSVRGFLGASWPGIKSAPTCL